MGQQPASVDVRVDFSLMIHERPMVHAIMHSVYTWLNSEYDSAPKFAAVRQRLLSKQGRRTYFAKMLAGARAEGFTFSTTKGNAACTCM
jgi:hypothetical protein